MQPLIIIHGGAADRPTDDKLPRIQASMAAHAAAVLGQLEAGMSALDAVVEAVRLLEDDPLYNAGTGAKLQRDGEARLSASLMDGATETFSGVVSVQGLRNPVILARHLQGDEDSAVLEGSGALAFARELGLEEVDVRTPERLAEWRQRMEGRTGTVGACALDANGRLAAATSTGGRGMERPGRVSDSCTPAGNFASKLAACSATGIGEHILNAALCARLVAAVDGGISLEVAADAVNGKLATHEWEAGFIALDRDGHFVARHTTPYMAWRVMRADGLVAGHED